MIAETFIWRAADGWSPAAPAPDDRASLVLLMGDRGVVDSALAPTELGLDVVDGTICITTVRERPVDSPDLPHDTDAPDPQRHQHRKQNQQNQEG